MATLLSPSRSMCLTSVRGNDPSSPLGPIGVIRRAVEDGLLSERHLRHAFVPSLQHNIHYILWIATPKHIQDYDGESALYILPSFFRYTCVDSTEPNQVAHRFGAFFTGCKLRGISSVLPKNDGDVFRPSSLLLFCHPMV